MASPINVTATGLAIVGAGRLSSMFIGTDGLYDPQITIHDNAASAAGIEILPTTIFDASALGLNGFTLGDIISALDFKFGLYVTVEASGGGPFGGTVEITLGVIRSRSA